MPAAYLAKIVIALLLGSAIGFEREANESHTNKSRSSGRGSLGVRSYALISLLGVLSGLLYNSHIVVFIFTVCIFGALLAGYYILGSLANKDVGMTTELAILLSFLFGIFLGLDVFPVQLVIALTIVLILVMSLKSEIQSVITRVRHHEIEAFISYALIALVILPFLPDASVTLSGIPGLVSILESAGIRAGSIVHLELLNPFNLWKVVVIITGIDIAGYVFEKTIGQKNSWLLTSIAGGFISSTSTTQSLAIRSKKSVNINGLVAAAIFANLSSFVQHFLLIVSVNVALMVTGIPYLISILGTGLVTGLFFMSLSRKDTGKDMTKTRKEMNDIQIFSLKPALMFAVLFTVIKMISKISLMIFGQKGFFVTSAIASLTGLDAVTMSVGEIAGKSISYQTGIVALFFANAINLLAKTFYCFTQGNRKFAFKFGIAALVIIGMSAVSLVFLH